jgi:hypothetical protein
MRVLFITSDNDCKCDYLSDSIFHGMRSLLGANVVDFPKAERMYKSAPPGLIEEIRGHGFTLYGLLDDLPVERPNTLSSAHIRGNYDLIVIGDIWRSWKVYASIHKALDPTNCVILDGEDHPKPYNYSRIFWTNYKTWRVSGTGRIPYFKREILPETLVYRSYGLLPWELASRLLRFAPWKKTAFAIPEEKVIAGPYPKDKLMAAHVVDPEVAAYFRSEGNTGYAFDNEHDYYADLRRSRFAITTKRAGWDCLRHYEIAANGCVPCFRDLDKKPESCAPHGLDQTNCVIYSDLPDLLRQIETMGDVRYELLRDGILKWARENTTVARAKEIFRGSGHLGWQGHMPDEAPRYAPKAADKMPQR